MIKATGLTKTYQVRGHAVEAVKGVDLDVAPGEIVGFLGPNGAGKTTTQRMLSTLLKPTAGDAVVAGCDLRTDPKGVRARIGYVGQGSGAGPEQRVEEELVMQGQLYGLSTAVARARAADLLGRFDLAGTGERLTATLSGGQKRRLDICMGIVHQPELVFLDEPSTGLDPQSRSNLWDHITALRDEAGTAVFLTTHYLDEADALCDRIVLIDHGRIVAEGTAAELKATVAGDLVVLETSVPEMAVRLAGRVPGAAEVAVDGAELRFRAPRAETVLPTLLRHLYEAGVDVLSIQTHRPTLDDVFLTYTGRSLRDGPAAPPAGPPAPPIDADPAPAAEAGATAAAGFAAG